MVFCVTKDPEHRIGLPSVKRERLSASPLPVNPKRGRVSRICIVQFATGNVGHQIQCRYKDRQRGVFQNAGNSTVCPCREMPSTLKP